jgi:hypothetical protein
MEASDNRAPRAVNCRHYTWHVDSAGRHRRVAAISKSAETGVVSPLLEAAGSWSTVARVQDQGAQQLERPYNIQMEPTSLARSRVPADAAHLGR